MTPQELRADIPALRDTSSLYYGAHGPSPEYVGDVDDPAAAGERVADRDIVLRSLPFPEESQVSVHAVSTEAEIDEGLGTLEAYQ